MCPPQGRKRRYVTSAARQCGKINGHEDATRLEKKSLYRYHLIRYSNEKGGATFSLTKLLKIHQGTLTGPW